MPHQRLFTPKLIVHVAAPAFHAMNRTTEASHDCAANNCSLDGVLQTLGNLLRLQTFGVQIPMRYFGLGSWRGSAFCCRWLKLTPTWSPFSCLDNTRCCWFRGQSRVRLALQRWNHTQMHCWDEPRSGACSEAVTTDAISAPEHDKP